MAGAVVLVALVSGAITTQSQSLLLLQDDVNHDAALGTVFRRGGGHGVRGVRGRHQDRSLSKDASVADFFKAALDGDFSHGGAVKDATDGIFSQSANTGMARAHGKSHVLKVTHKARMQALAETKLHMKAAHEALAAEAHADRRALDNERSAGLVPSSKEQQMLALIRKREQKLAQKYPSEDKFVARYTGAVPSDDVPVDSVTFGKYVPL